MNKKDLIEALAKKEKMSKAAAERSINSIFDIMGKGLKKAGRVSLIGFGTFNVKKRKARTGRNPQTGEKIRIKARKVVAFKASKTLSESV